MSSGNEHSSPGTLTDSGRVELKNEPSESSPVGGGGARSTAGVAHRDQKAPDDRHFGSIAPSDKHLSCDNNRYYAPSASLDTVPGLYQTMTSCGGRANDKIPLSGQNCGMMTMAGLQHIYPDSNHMDEFARTYAGPMVYYHGPSANYYDRIMNSSTADSRA